MAYKDIPMQQAPQTGGEMRVGGAPTQAPISVAPPVVPQPFVPQRDPEFSVTAPVPTQGPTRDPEFPAFAPTPTPFQPRRDPPFSVGGPPTMGSPPVRQPEFSVGGPPTQGVNPMAPQNNGRARLAQILMRMRGVRR